MLPPDSSFPYEAEHIQGFRCIPGLNCQDVTSSCLPRSQRPPNATGAEGFLAVCLFHGAMSHRLFIYSEGATLSASPRRTFNERRFVDAKTVMIVFITTSAGAADVNHFWLADWKMLRRKESRSRVDRQPRSVTSNPESLPTDGDGARCYLYLNATDEFVVLFSCRRRFYRRKTKNLHCV